MIGNSGRQMNSVDKDVLDQDVLVPEDLDSGPATLAACLPSLLAALGWNGDQSSLAEFMPPPGKDLTMEQVLSRMERLRCKVTRNRIKSLLKDELVLPGLMEHPDGTYSCVIRREAEGFLVYSGQERSYVRLPFDQAESPRWRGNYAGFTESDEDPHARVGVYWIQNVLSDFRGILGLSLVFSFILAVFGVLTPQFMSLLYREIDAMVEPGNLLVLGMGVLLFVFGNSAFDIMRKMLLNYMGENMSEILGREVLRRVMYFPWTLGFNAGSKSQWGRIRDFEDIATQFSRPIAGALLDLPFMLILLIALGYMSGVLVMVPLLTIVIFLILMFFAYPVLRKTEQEAGAATAQTESRLDAALASGRGIQRWGLDDYWKQTLETAELDGMLPQLKKKRMVSLFEYSSQALVGIAGFFAVLTGAGEVMSGRLSPSVLLAAMMLVWRILDPLRSIFVLLGTIQTVVQNGRRLKKFMAISGERQPDPRLHPLRLDSWSLRVDGLYFRYPQSNHFVLANLGFNLPSNRCLVINGEAGSGKTSLCMILMGLLQANNGRILVGDQNIQQFNPGCLRKKIGYLPSRVPIMPASIRDNLRLARADSTDRELIEALEMAGALDALKRLPLGLDTGMDHRFVPPSPDFVVCIGIARLYLRNAKLWILDQPEQGLTRENRMKLLDNLQRLKGQITLLVLGNDPDYAQIADGFGILEQGRYKSTGSGSKPEGRGTS